jgi:hypothetical protein
MNTMIQGIVIGLLMLFGGQKGYEMVMADKNPMKTAAEERSRQMREDLERRRFNPPQDDQWRDSYVDLVIYTRDFAQQYQSEEFQKQWLKVASSYFVNKWRVQEEKTVQVISALHTLVGTLVERKQAIHPDYVKDGLKKMNELEAETMTRVKDLLGSEVRVEALKRLEKKTYMDFYSMRQPATQPPQGAPAK